MAVMHGWDVFAHRLLAQRLAAGGSVRLTVTTSSMAPFLLPGDGVMLAPVSAQSLRAGDIVALSALPQPIVHRVVAAPDGWGKRPLRTKGDTGSTYDRPLPSHTVLGCVIAVQRGDRVLPLTTRSSHVGALVLAKISCLSAGTAQLPSPFFGRATRFLLRQAMRITAGLLWRMGQHANGGTRSRGNAGSDASGGGRLRSDFRRTRAHAARKFEQVPAMTTTDVPRIIVLSVAGLRLALDIAALPPQQQEVLLGDYAPFLLPHTVCCGRQAVDVVVDLAVAEGPGFLEPEPGHLWRIDTRQESGRLVYRSYYEQGWLDLRARRGYLLLRPQAQPENFLRVTFALLALAHDCLLLHASGLIHDGRGYVFFGHSGAGKSTVAGFALPGSTLLSDDLVLLRLHRELQGDPACSTPGRLWLHGVPFRGEALPVPRPNAAAPVAGLYALRQASSHALAPLPAPLSAASLLACTPFIDGDPFACRQALATCTAIAQAVPIHTLAFARDPGFWHLLTGKEARTYDNYA